MDFKQIVSIAMVFVCVVASISIIYYTLRNGISPMPSSRAARNEVMKRVGQLSSAGDLVVDAGSGWGTLAVPLAVQHPYLRVIGVENSPVPLWFSRLRKQISMCANAHFVKGNVYAYPYEKADFIVCYLYPGAMKRLSELLLGGHAKPGTWIISVAFALPGWQPEQVYTCTDLYRTKIYLYQR
jgi:hypothetical protein